MECGVESATDSSTGVQTMPELSVASLDSPMKVVVKLQSAITYFFSHYKGAYVVQDALVDAFGTSERPPLLGDVHCIGTEPGWLECSHSSIGSHFCGNFHSPVPDVVISCHGIAHISFAFSSISYPIIIPQQKIQAVKKEKLG